MEMNNRARRRVFAGFTLLILMMAAAYLWATLRQNESTLAIRPAAQGTSIPDGFSIWHHLDANGIRFKSITPENNSLLIKFDSSAQSAAAKEVLDRSLPSGYIIAQQDDDSQATIWLSRLRDTSHRFG
ncbi:SecD-like export protein [Enterobacter sp. BIGb0383]|uniref:EnvZ/OmpR regulon moderator MzrA n=1 Tax=unclassified Enterobacter TaxID=2608935 RepID=UPI000F4601AB|nr:MULTISPECIES: EnvZ/OmpR regulon moderator MzrA [unclassified Enterobacter]ROP58119.1 SecD-like export protein [Enterobacter sp. BIGb0383]ROS00814.1 SecD-like export protein [Enterobacter sp. BIGb0359]